MWILRRPATGVFFVGFFIFILVCQNTAPLLTNDLDGDGIEETNEEPEQSLAPRAVLMRPTPKHCLNRKFVVGVHIRVASSEGREEWRSTFGQLQDKYNFCLFFGLGLPANNSDLSDLRREMALHNDLLLGDFEDTYRNMTHKHLMLLRYFHHELSHVPFLVKLDDDVAVNVDKLYEFISLLHVGTPPWFTLDTTVGPKIWCNVWSNTLVRRAAGGKWSIPRSQWIQRFWPDYCAGMGYIATQETAERLLEAAEHERWLWVDDIFVTGVLAQKANIKHVQMSPYYNFDEEDQSKFQAGYSIFQLTQRNGTLRSFEAVN